MKTLIATAVIALGIAFAPAHAINMSQPSATTPPNMSVKPAQANCYFQWHSSCNGYCWVCH